MRNVTWLDTEEMQIVNKHEKMQVAKFWEIGKPMHTWEEQEVHR